MEAAYRVQPARSVPRRDDFRSERCVAPGTPEAALHGLQSAGAVDRPRQVAVEKAARVTPDPCPRVRGLPHRTAGSTPQAADLPSDREVVDAGSFDRHLA